MARFSLALMSLLYASTAVWHLCDEDFFLSIMPPWVPRPRWTNRAVALVEAMLALGLCFESLRPMALLGIVLFLIAVFPVHLHMLNDPTASRGLPRWVFWSRLPLQGLLIAWAWVHF